MSDDRADAGSAADELIPVEVAYARPDVQKLVALEVPRGTTMVEALRRSGLVESFPEIDPATAPLGIFGTVIRDRDHVLGPRDRVEVYRPLLNDPKEIRARRAKEQKARAAREQAAAKAPERPDAEAK